MKRVAMVLSIAAILTACALLNEVGQERSYAGFTPTPTREGAKVLPTSDYVLHLPLVVEQKGVDLE